MKTIEVEGETIYLKKSFFGWGVINPINIKPIIENGKINWKNINWKNLIAGGHWGKLILVLAFCGILIGAMLEFSNAVQIANECLKNNPLAIIP